MLATCFLIYTTLIPNIITNQVSLYDIAKLDFYKTKLTNDKKSQVICKEDYLNCPRNIVNEISCINLSYGKKNKKIIWECRADLPFHYQFKKTEVVCKGGEDNIVNKESCFVEYKLKFNIAYI